MGFVESFSNSPSHSSLVQNCAFVEMKNESIERNSCLLEGSRKMYPCFCFSKRFAKTSRRTLLGKCSQGFSRLLSFHAPFSYRGKKGEKIYRWKKIHPHPCSCLGRMLFCHVISLQGENGFRKKTSAKMKLSPSKSSFLWYLHLL